MMRRYGTALITLLLLIPTTAAANDTQAEPRPAPPASDVLHFVDEAGLADLLRMGDRTSLLQLRTRAAQWPDSLYQMATESAFYRLDGQYDEAINMAERCLAESRRRLLYIPTILCGLIGASTRVAQGDLPAWARETLRTREITLEVARRARVDTPIDRIDVFLTIPDATPLLDRKRPSTIATGPRYIPFLPAPDGAQQTRDLLRLRIDGRSADAIINTAAMQTMLAADLVPPPFMTWTQPDANPGAEVPPRMLAQAGELQLGDLKIASPFIATHPHARNHGRDGDIGLDVLSRFGKVLIEERGLAVAGPAVDEVRCYKPLSFLTDLPGLEGALIMQLNIDGTDRDVVVASAWLDELIQRIPAGEPFPPGQDAVVVSDSISGTSLARTRSSVAWIVESGLMFPVQMEVRRGSHQLSPRFFAIGAGILRKASIFLDFDNRKACLVPKISLQIGREPED
ncbi:MAG TPA: hypothetical protein VD865_06810 [Stenotrophomonas sp.]|nr:hypothetical protein [Stenotrophomonas sp.]